MGHIKRAQETVESIDLKLEWLAFEYERLRELREHLLNNPPDDVEVNVIPPSPFSEHLKTINSEWKNKIDSSKQYVYLCYCEETKLHKIGYSKQPIRRMYQVMQEINKIVDLIHVIPCHNPVKLEMRLHVKYDEDHVHGEWFNLTEKQVHEIKGLK